MTIARMIGMTMTILLPVAAVFLLLQKSRVLWAFQTKTSNTDPKLTQQNNDDHGIYDAFAKITPEKNNKTHGQTKGQNILLFTSTTQNLMFSGSWQKKNLQKRETLCGGRHNAYPVRVVVVVVVVVYCFFLLVCVLVRMDAAATAFRCTKAGKHRYFFCLLKVHRRTQLLSLPDCILSEQTTETRAPFGRA